MPIHRPQHFGRIRLTQVLQLWSAEHPLNPRYLASELAGVLRTVGPCTQVLSPAFASATLFDPTTGASGITVGALADYFDRYAAGASADTVETTKGAVQAAAVLLSRQWLARLEIEADARATLAAGLQQIAPEPFATNGAQPAGQNLLPLSGSDPQCLALLQEKHRREGDQQAVKQLEAVKQENASLKQLITRLQAENDQARWAKHDTENRIEQHRREAQEERRKRTLAEDQLRDHSGIIAFMNAENPLAPVEGQRMVNAWCEITNNGTENNVSLKGKGLSAQITEWLKRNFPSHAACAPGRYTWALTWPARKKGGVAARKPLEKG